MRDLPLVSILMTSYNRENFIAEAIESVLASTYINFELIIVDDGSKDRTVEIARTYEVKDMRVKVYINEKNLGDYPNRNQAASYAIGKYIKYVDADDLIYPWGLEILVNSMEKFPEAGWGLCSLEQNIYIKFPFELSGADIYRYEYFGPGLFHKAPLSSIIRKNAFHSIGGFSGKKHLGDYELWHLLSLRFSVVLMPHGVVWYREHEEQQSKDNRTDVEVPFKYIVSAYNFFNTYKFIPIDDTLRKSISEKLKTKIYKTIISKLVKFKFEEALILFKAFNKKEYNFMLDER